MDFLASLEAVTARGEPEEIQSVLLELSNIAILKNFVNVARESLIDGFKVILTFLLKSSLHSDNTVKLTSYRTTVSVIYRLGVFYLGELTAAFEQVSTQSTVDLHPSLLMAGIYGIISYFKSRPFCDEFVVRCPVFHHFSSDEKTTPEFISGIIQLLSHLDADFHRNLFDLFMKHNSLRVIPLVVEQGGKKLFAAACKELQERGTDESVVALAEIYNNVSYKPGKANVAASVKLALKVVSQFKEKSYSVIDAALSIIGMESAVKVDISGGTVRISYEEECVEVPLAEFADRPSFYKLRIPMSAIKLTDRDGGTMVSAKFTALLFHLEDDASVLEIVAAEALKDYGTRQSALLRSVAAAASQCSSEYLVPLFNAVQPCLFQQSCSWFHDLHKLNVISAFISMIFSSSTELWIKNEIFDMLLSFALQENDKVSEKAQIILTEKILNKTNQRLVYKICRMCDVFDCMNFKRTLELLTRLANKIGKVPIPQCFIDELQEVFPFYWDHPDVFIRMCYLLALSGSSDISPSIITFCLAVISSSYQATTGIEWKIRDIPDEYKNVARQLVENEVSDLASGFPQKFDKGWNRTPGYAAFTLLAQSGTVPKVHVWPIIDHFLVLYPEEVTQFIKKYWTLLDDQQRLKLVSSNFTVLKFVSSYNVFCTWLTFFTQVYSQQNVAELYMCQRFFCQYIDNVIQQGADGVPASVLVSYIKFYEFIKPNFEFDMTQFSEGKRAQIEQEMKEGKTKAMQASPSHSKRAAGTPLERPTAIQIKDMLQNAIARKEFYAVNNILLMANKYNIVIDTTKIKWPVETLVYVALYLKAVKSDAYDEFCAVHRSQYLKYILPKEKITKKEAREFCIWMNVGKKLSPKNSVAVLKRVLEWLRDSNSKTRKTWLIIASNLITHMCKIVPSALVSLVASIVNDQIADLSIQHLIRFLMEFCGHVDEADKPKDLLTSIRSNFSTNSINCNYIIAELNSGIAFDQQHNVMTVVSPILETNIPSLYCAGIRVILREFRLDSTNVEGTLKSVVSSLAAVNERFGHNFFVHRELSIYLTQLFASQKHPSLIAMITRNAKDMIPLSRPSLYEYANVYNMLDTINDRHFTSLNNPLTIRAFILAAKTNCRRNRDDPEYAINLFRKSLKRMKLFDNTTFAEGLFGWFVILSRKMTVNEILCEVEPVGRFLPVFVATCKWLKQRGNGSLEDVAVYVNSEVKARVTAFTLAIKDNQMKKALDLAKYGFDGDVTNKIIEDLNSLETPVPGTEEQE